MVHVIKVFLKEDNSENQEIRRVAVGSDVMNKYGLLYEKIKELFPGLKSKSFVLGWKDPEGDLIQMSSDDELAQALANVEDSFLKIYASLKCDKQNSNESSHNAQVHDEIHAGAVCDACNMIICGYRYKCLQCKDYDLCSSCNAAHKHPDHDMIKLVRPTYFAREWVFLGARKIWRSMFGRNIGGLFENMGRPNCRIGKEKHEQFKKEKRPTCESEKWYDAFAHIWKGELNPADKIFTDSIGNFLKMAGVEVKVGECPFEKKYSDDMETSDEASSDNIQEPEKNYSEVKISGDKNGEVLKDESEKNVETVNLSENELKLEGTCKTEDNLVNPSPNSEVRGLFFAGCKAEKKAPSSNANEMESSNCADDWTLLNNEDSAKKASTSEPSTSNSDEEPKSSCADEEENKLLDQEPTCDPKIANALTKMYAMGFTNEGGWLEKLLVTKEGNINAALDALYPNTHRH